MTKKKRTFTHYFIDEKLKFMELRYSNNAKHYKEHIHETFSIGINIFGKSIYTNKTSKYDFDTKMLAVINPNIVHSCNPIDEKSANEYYMLYLDKTWCYEIQKSISNKIDSFKDFNEDILYDENLYIEFKTMCELLLMDTSTMEKENELINFFTKLFSKDIKNDRKKVQDINFEKICSYLEKNYKENILLEELASKFELNSFYIIRLFKSQINLTPHAYLLNIKINKAKELLKNGLSIVETALECGFTDQSHFHRNFVKIVATTPKEYQLNFVQD